MILIVFAIIGRLLVWTIQTSTPTLAIKQLLKWVTIGAADDFWDDLWKCDFCMGFWVFLPLTIMFEINILEPLYFVGFSEIVTALMASFVVHLANLGWKSKWGYETLE